MQAVFLGMVVQSSGDTCIGKKAFHMGVGTKGASKDVAFWSVRCSNGKSYAVQINPDAGGSSTVLDCGVLRA